LIGEYRNYNISFSIEACSKAPSFPTPPNTENANPSSPKIRTPPSPNSNSPSPHPSMRFPIGSKIPLTYKSSKELTLGRRRAESMLEGLRLLPIR